MGYRRTMRRITDIEMNDRGKGKRNIESEREEKENGEIPRELGLQDERMKREEIGGAGLIGGGVNWES